MFFSHVRKVQRHGISRLAFFLAGTGAMIALLSSLAMAQTGSQPPSGLSNVQRLDVMRSKLEALRRSLDSAIAGVNAKDSGDKTKDADDPRARLRQ